MSGPCNARDEFQRGQRRGQTQLQPAAAASVSEAPEEQQNEQDDQDDREHLHTSQIRVQRWVRTARADSGVRLALGDALSRGDRAATPGLHEKHERDHQPDDPHDDEDGADGRQRDA